MDVRSAVVLMAVGAFVVSGCSDGTSPSTAQRMGLSFASQAGTGPVAGLLAAPGSVRMAGDTLVIAVNNDTLKITSVELVLREIELKRATAPDCDSTSRAEDCEEFSIGPQLVSLPLAPGAQQVIAADIDSGTYTKVEFEIHKPGGDPADQQFLAAHPDFANVSIRVRGLFNGTPFTYTTPMDQEQEYEFNPPVVIGGTAAANLTILMDVGTWFRVGGTGALIDPATANVGGQNEGAVRENIKNSIEAFEDDDRDGDRSDG